MIREITRQELPALLALYTHLHDNELPVMDQALEQLWRKIIDDENHHILAAEIDGQIISSCVLIIVPNLTHGQRPYGLVENVVTHPRYRRQGYAAKVLRQARAIAQKNRCYKIMLLTGAKEEATLRFYEKAGYNSEDKTAFVQWLD